MPKLIPPDTRLHRSFLAAMAEFQGEGRGGPDDDSNVGRAIRAQASRWAEPAEFTRYLRELEDDAREESPRPAGRVPQTMLWWVSGDEYLGQISIRHRLTVRLREIGGHIGHDIRPSARRRGHATAMLAAALPAARSLGINPALLTCDENNIASRKVIEANGCVLEDVRSGTVTTPRSVSRMTAAQVTVPGGWPMQRALVTTAAAIILTALAMSTAGCGTSPAAGVPPTVHAPASDWSAVVMEAEVYAQVLRRYLSTPAENSFPGRAFKTVYVLNQAYPDAADPTGTHRRGTSIAPQTQRRVTAALAGVTHVIFIADRGSVIEAGDGCGQVRNGGILITLGPPVSHGHEMQVAINGFVACLGATWLTYVLHDQPGVGWRVTGTTGSMAIS